MKKTRNGVKRGLLKWIETGLDYCVTPSGVHRRGHAVAQNNIKNHTVSRLIRALNALPIRSKNVRTPLGLALHRDRQRRVNEQTIDVFDNLNRVVHGLRGEEERACNQFGRFFCIQGGVSR